MFHFNKCIKLNKRSVLFILFSYIVNHIQITSTALNQMEGPLKSEYYKNSSMTSDSAPVTILKNQQDEDGVQSCPSNLECQTLQFPCINCKYNTTCIYGNEVNVTCEAKSNINCTGDRNFTRPMICRYCFLTHVWEHSCIQKGNCLPSAGPYRTNCTVHSDVLCFGQRTFYKNIKCNWTQGIKWSTALIISITLGGFGADRFYLGHWQEGIGKLFSFGGLGVWTLIDVILISLHYLGPADGSLFI